MDEPVPWPETEPKPCHDIPCPGFTETPITAAPINEDDLHQMYASGRSIWDSPSMALASGSVTPRWVRSVTGREWLNDPCERCAHSAGIS